MADITVTAANVLASTNAYYTLGIFGETVTAGMCVYKYATDGKYYKAESDNAAHDDCAGIALNGGSAGQPAVIQSRGDITIGGTVAIGTIYVVSAAAGGICPNADLVSTNYVTEIGVGVSATDIRMNLNTTAIQKA